MEISEYTPNKKGKKIILIIIGIILAIAVVIVTSLYVVNEEFREMVDIHVLRKEITENSGNQIIINTGENTQIYAYDKYVAILNKSTLSIYNQSAEETEKISTMITNPIFTSNGKYLALAEKNGQKIYLIKDKEKQWEREIEGNIVDIKVNRNGYISVIVTGTSYKTVIITIDENGKEIFKTYLATLNAITTSISNNNKYLAIAEVNSSSAIIQSDIKIISIEKAKTDPTNSIVYTHKAESNELITDIKYQDKETLVCLYDDKVAIIEGTEQEQEIQKINQNADFIDIKLKNHIAQTLETTEFFKTNIELQIKNTNNKTESTYLTSGVLKSLKVSDEIVALNLSTEVHFVNTNGWLIKKYVSNKGVTDIVVGNQIAGIIYKNKVEIIKL